MVEPKVEPEIRFPIPQPWFVLRLDQGFFNFFAHVPLPIKNIILQHLIYARVKFIMAFSFHRTASFWRCSQKLEIDRYGFFEADNDILKIFKSCFLLHYQK